MLQSVPAPTAETSEAQPIQEALEVTYGDPEYGHIQLIVSIVACPTSSADEQTFKKRMLKYGIRKGILCDPAQVHVFQEIRSSVFLHTRDFESVSFSTPKLFGHVQVEVPDSRFKHVHADVPDGVLNFESHAKRWLAAVVAGGQDTIHPDAVSAFGSDVVKTMSKAKVGEVRFIPGYVR